MTGLWFWRCGCFLPLHSTDIKAARAHQPQEGEPKSKWNYPALAFRLFRVVRGPCFLKFLRVCVVKFDFFFNDTTLTLQPNDDVHCYMWTRFSPFFGDRLGSGPVVELFNSALLRHSIYLCVYVLYSISEAIISFQFFFFFQNGGKIQGLRTKRLRFKMEGFYPFALMGSAERTLCVLTIAVSFRTG